MGGRKSKEKGKRGEREAAKLLSSLLGVELSRGIQFQGSPDSPDIAGLKEYGLHPEIKRDETTISKALLKAFAQAENDSDMGDIPFVMSRRNREEWIISIKAEKLIDFCKAVYEIQNKV